MTPKPKIPIENRLELARQMALKGFIPDVIYQRCGISEKMALKAIKDNPATKNAPSPQWSLVEEIRQEYQSRGWE